MDNQPSIEIQANGSVTNHASIESSKPANYIYYVDVGVGYWVGTFQFAITNWKEFRRARIGWGNRILALTMHFVSRLTGKSHITSELVQVAGQQGTTVENIVEIRKWRVTTYLLIERYTLDPDGRKVQVSAHERFGPVPFLFNHRKKHPAEVLDGGLKAVYYIPLLGSQWIGVYKVRADHQHIDSDMSCTWARAQESIDKVR
jgi:hypothetical protein